MEKITSLNNPKIKRFGHLEKARERKAQNVFVIEGYREILMAYNSGFQIIDIFICLEISSNIEINKFITILKCNKYEITRPLFEKIAYRENSDGILAIAEPRNLNIESVKLSRNPVILVLEAVEKPGNLGAILRTSDAAAVDAIFVCDTQTDIYNPNVIRASLGCVFTNQLITCTTQEALDFFKNHKIKTYAACLNTENFYHETDLSGPVAIIMGTEADGLTEKWLNSADYKIKIPMLGKVDSLNVSTSAAILIYESLRQRKFKNH